MQGSVPSARAHKVGMGPWNQQPPSQPHSARVPRAIDTPNQTSRSNNLCPELVVPHGSECVLAVRCLVTSRLQQVEFDVLDINGKPVLRVEVSHQSQFSARLTSQRSPTVMLKSLNPRDTTGSSLLCYSSIVARNGKESVCIYTNDHEVFAEMTKDNNGKRYVLSSDRLGMRLLLEGNFEEHAVDVANESRELLAATEP